MIRTTVPLRLFPLLVLAAATVAAAQPVPQDRPTSRVSVITNAPPAPVPPEVLNRDERGRTTMRAVRLERPLTLDGRLDEEIYQRVPGAGSFVQQLPRQGAPATESTDVWVFFDDLNLYVSVRCDDSQPEREVVNELRRDNAQGINGNEGISLAIDTFYDRRNGFSFQTNPMGLVRDQAVFDDNANDAWNTVWDVRTSRSDKGWEAEFVIPFKSLRYSGAGEQVWGFNVRRYVRWKNELSFLSAVPAQYGPNAINQMNVNGTLVGVETPAQSVNLEIKPHVISTLTTDKTAAQPFSNDLSASAGFGFKYGLTRGLIADVTVNPDFAQVEEDVQQVNLTRFNLFFDEKRDFFLEGIGIFGFAGLFSAVRGQGPTDREVPLLFFSRQIGLNQGLPVPVVGGGRVAGKVGKYSLGVLNIQTDDKASANAVATNFSVVRVRREILSRSSIGMMATRRDPTLGKNGSNIAAGIDASFRFLSNVNITSYYAQTKTDGLEGDDVSYRGKFDYAGDRYGLMLEHTMVGSNFNPEVGFMRRDDFRRSYGLVRFSPRTRQSRTIRKLTWQANVDYIANAAGDVVQDREYRGLFGIEFHNSDLFQTSYAKHYEFLPRNFMISPGVVVPVDGYDYQTLTNSYTLGTQRKLSGTFSLSNGTLYGGTKTEAAYNGRVIITPRFALEPGLSLNWVELPFGDFTARLVNMRIIVAPGPRMAISSLIQYNDTAHSLSSSVRLRWEYIPGSELFVVYSDGRGSVNSALSDLMSRSFAVKITRLLRF